MKLDDKDLAKLREFESAITKAKLQLADIVLTRMEAEAAERKAGAAALSLAREGQHTLRELALRAGIDPDKPFHLDLNVGTIDQEPAK